MVNENNHKFNCFLHLWRVPGVALGVFGVSLWMLVGCLGRRWTVPTGAWWVSGNTWGSMGILWDPLGVPGGSLCGHWASLGIHERPIRKRGLKDLNKFTDRAL